VEVLDRGVQTEGLSDTSHVLFDSLEQSLEEVRAEPRGEPVSLPEPKYSFREGSKFPTADFPEVLKKHERVLRCRDPGCPLTKEGEAAYYEYRKEVMAMARRPLSLQALDALPDKEVILQFLLKVADLKPSHDARIKEMIEVLALCQLWQLSLRSDTELLQRFSELGSRGRRWHRRKAEPPCVKGQELGLQTALLHLKAQGEWPLSAVEEKSEDTFKICCRALRLGQRQNPKDDGEVGRADDGELHEIKELLRFVIMHVSKRRTFTRQIAEVLNPFCGTLLYRAGPAG